MKTTKESIKNYLSENRMFIFAWTLIAAYLAVTLPIHYSFSAFSWYWFVFGLIAVGIPAGLLCDYSIRKKRASNLHNLKSGVIKYTLFYWLADCVYMAIFNEWTTCIYVLGIITLIVVFINLSNTFLKTKKSNALLNFFNVCDLIIGLALTVYLIYIIPEEFNSLQTIITTVVAAVYGGLLTLVGVAWTIHKSDNDRREDDVKKFRPIFNLMGEKVYEAVPIPFSGLVTDEQFSFNKIDGILYYIKEFAITNTFFSEFYLCGLRINNKTIRFDEGYYIKREKTYAIDFQYKPFYFFSEINKIEIEVEDLLGNKYYANLNFTTNIITAEILEDKSVKKFMGHTSKVSTGLQRTEEIICIKIHSINKAVMEEK